MRRAGSFIIGCMCIAMCSCGGKSVVEAPAHSSIAVSVTEFPGGGLAGFEISLSPYSRLSVTDSTGSVVFTDLPVGKYTIGISKAGYTPMYEIVTLGDIEASIEFSYVRGKLNADARPAAGGFRPAASHVAKSGTNRGTHATGGDVTVRACLVVLVWTAARRKPWAARRVTVSRRHTWSFGFSFFQGTASGRR
jgi:hypothetical protein